MNRALDVLVCGYYGFGNLGDELLADAVVALLEDAGIAKERIGILSAKPNETRDRLGVNAFDRWNFRSVYSAIKSARTLLLGGGGLFQDSTSVRSSLYYWFIVRLASFCSSVPWAVGQSIGPLKSAAASRLAYKAFSRCVYRGVRNKNSLHILNSWGLTGALAPDPVMSLKIKRKSVEGGALLLNLRVGYKSVSDSAVKFAIRYADENALKIIGVAFSDEDVLELKKYSNSENLKLEQITVVKNIIGFENIVNEGKCAVGMRLHFVMLSHLAGLPICGAPYDPKVRSFCEEWNIPLAEGGMGTFSAPSESMRLETASEIITESFRQGLEIAIGDADGKK